MCAAVSTCNQNVEIYQLRQLVADLTREMQVMREEMDWLLDKFECTCCDCEDEDETEMATQVDDSASDSDSASDYEQPPPTPYPDFDCETLMTAHGINDY